jgi:hypothetical protein
MSLNFELNDNKHVYYDDFWHILFIKFSGSQTFVENLLPPFFSNNINICMRHYWLNRYLLWGSITG